MKSRLGLIFMLCMLLITLSYARDENAYPFTSTADAARFDTITQETRCLVCQNQTIADSNAPLANDLRNKIYEMVIAKQSDTEIEEYLVSRYGEFILFKPRLNESTLFLWFFPLAALLMVFVFLVRIRR
jgi:cytochrome c-type biogenesis protein CcmH